MPTTPSVLALVLGFLACSGREPDDTDDTVRTGVYGPENSWYHAPDASVVPEDSEATGWGVGELPPNLRFTDQNGDEVWLYQFHGQTVYIDWVAEWCGPCATFAPFLEGFYAAHSDESVVITVLLEDQSGGAGDASAVARWVDAHSATNPVVWLDSEELDRAPDIYTFPTISLLDPELRFAQRSVNSLYDDPWIQQVVSRMTFAIGGSLDNDAEVCDDGFDNDLDLIADCMDSACADHPACVRAEVQGSLSPCTPDPDKVASPVDVWQVEVDVVAALEGDTVSAATGFEHIVFIKPDGADWSEGWTLGDDEWDCTHALEDFGCARGWILPGTWQLAVYSGTGGDPEDGDCVDPELGEYALRLDGMGTLELLQDDVTRGELGL